jgi:hypothetical protein
MSLMMRTAFSDLPAREVLIVAPSPPAAEGSSVAQQAMLGEGAPSSEARLRRGPLTHQNLLTHLHALPLKGRGRFYWCRHLLRIERPT